MILLEQLMKSFGETTAVNGVSMKVEAGESVVIQGPSGSGKSTLLRLIAGLELPDHGKIQMDGAWVSGPGWATPPHSRTLGVVFQQSALWPHMTVAQNIRFAIRDPDHMEGHIWLDHLLDRTDLTKLADRYPSQLSGGEARRAALARAMAPRPKRLLLDEPLSSVDPERRLHLLEVLRAYTHQTGCTMLYITHIQEEAAQVSGRLLRMQEGRLLEGT
jgi:iron(III) transport system ATP-binding protein